MRLKKHLLLFFSILTISLNSNAQFARVQLINNCPDLSLNAVDVYVNGILTFDDVFFRDATSFKNVTATVPINIGIAPATSVSVNDTIYNTTSTLTLAGIYIAVINGIKSTTGYSPARPLSLNIYNQGRELASIGSNTDILFINGATDAPTFDLRSDLKLFANDVAFNQYSPSGYYSIPTSDINLRLTNSSGSNTFKTYYGDFLNQAQVGKAVVLISSGFINPANNSNGAPFGLYFARANGGLLQPLTEVNNEPFARIQLIHNTADTALSSIDVYIDNQLAVDNLAFRNATAFMDTYGKIPKNIGIAPKNSNSVTDTVFSITTTLDSAKAYIAVINGTNDTAYHPNQGMSLNMYGGARETGSTTSGTDVLFFNGSTDAPNLSITQGANNIATNIAYGMFTSSYYTAVTGNNIYNVTNASNNSSIQDCHANLITDGFQGQTATVLSSGFVKPSTNKNGASFALYAAKSTGGPLVLFPPIVSVKDINGSNNSFEIWPNPVSDILFVKNNKIQGNTKISVFDIYGKLILESSNTSSIINVKELSAGTYFLRAENSAGEAGYQKFIKQ